MGGMMDNMHGEHSIIAMVIMGLLLVIPFWKIFPRAAWSGWLAIFMIIPVVNIIMLWILAFKKWPDDPGF